MELSFMENNKLSLYTDISIRGVFNIMIIVK